MNAPSKANEIKAILTAIIAFCTALWGWVGWAIFFMVGAMVLDYITGTLAARAHGEWSSKLAREGLWHKLGEIVALLVAALCDIAIEIILHSSAAPILAGWEYGHYITLIVALWYLFTEVGSILENAKKLGAPIPDWLIKGAAALKGKTEQAAPIIQQVEEHTITTSFMESSDRGAAGVEDEPPDASEN